MTDKIADIYLSGENEPGSGLASDQHFTDVIVVFEDGAKHVASFFSFEGLELLREHHRKTGEYLQGKYFWAPNMLLIDVCSRERIGLVIKELIEEGDFEQVFTKI